MEHDFKAWELSLLQSIFLLFYPNAVSDHNDHLFLIWPQNDYLLQKVICKWRQSLLT